MNQSSYPEYSELYVISDLHLGGEKPRMQIFNRGERLKKFLIHLRKITEDSTFTGKLALVLAGDVIDTLPYQEAKNSYISIDNATDILEKIICSFSDVFDGLSNFVDGEKCELIIMTGNHDLELALPEVQERLLQKIADQNFENGKTRNIKDASSARGRVQFFTQGAGFRCKVGVKKVYVTHGNETDKWNHVDHESLRKTIHARTLGQTFDSKNWCPNAGTQLVVNVMNEIKRIHPFIDLLKPEDSAAIPVLMALDLGVFKKLWDALTAAAKNINLEPTVVLGNNGWILQSEPESLKLLSDAMTTGIFSTELFTNSTLVARVEEIQSNSIKPEDLVSDDDTSLGFGNAVRIFGEYEIKQCWDKLWGDRSPEEALQQTLKKWIKNDESFKLDNQDDNYKGILGQIGDREYFDVVIAGHTHLPRWIKPGIHQWHPTYFNTGTWARLIGFREKWLEVNHLFKKVHDALKQEDICCLDDVEIEKNKNLILDVTVAAHVSNDENKEPELVRVHENKDDTSIIEVKPLNIKTDNNILEI